jgi:mannose-6-phosphate isomerase-like protein (cupin superfamily)
MSIAEKLKQDTVQKHPVHRTRDNAPSVKGRREFFKYLDLGVTEATEGMMRAQLTVTSEGLTEPTGWHYHVCDSQFIYLLKGWVDLEFEDGSKIRVKEGESLYIPGGLRHNESATSAQLEILEISIPAEMGTVPTDAPDGSASKSAY